MSKQSVNQVIQRAISDAAFRRQLQRDPATALSGFDLSKDERAAITSGDPTRLTALGVDQRMSKAFGLGGLSEVSKTVAGDDIVAGGGAAFIDEGSAAGTADATIPGNASPGTGIFVDADGTTLDAGHADPNAQTNAVIVGDPASLTSAVSSGEASGMSFDGNSIDAGAISSRATDFVDVGDGSAGTATLDAGAPTGGYAAADPGDLATDGTVLGDETGGLDTGGDVRPTE